MNRLEVTDDQLSLIQRALDFYSRVGIGQFWIIKEHPTFEEHLHDVCTLKKGPLEVGDKTVRGEVVEIGPKGKWIKTKGRWNGEEEIRKWTDPENIKHSTDYSRFHQIRDNVDVILTQPRNMLINDPTLPQHGSWGIYQPSVHDTCRMAFDIVQVIRHERWKKDPGRSQITVDSHIHFSHRKDGSSDLIKCKLDIDKEGDE
jgi:hypothetical protein